MRKLFIVMLVAACGIGFLSYSADATQLMSPLAKKYAKEMDKSQKDQVRTLAEAWITNPSYTIIMSRISICKPIIDTMCEVKQVDPWPIYGLFMTETSGNPYIYDGVFTSGLSNKSHGGMGQLSSTKLDLPDDVPGILLRWRRAYRRRDKREADRLWKILMVKDPRLNLLKNLEKTIDDYAASCKSTGDPLMALQGHHGGPNDPIRELAYYRLDTDGGKFNESGIAHYATTNHLTYWDMLRYDGPNSDYWEKKKEDHEHYAMKCMAASEAFYRYLNGIAMPKNYNPEKFLRDAKVQIGIEHNWYSGGDSIFKTAADLEVAAEKGQLLPAPSWMKNTSFKLDPDIGHNDPKNQKLYKMAKPQVWAAVYELEGIVKQKSGSRKPIFRISSTARSADYIKYGSKTTSHNYGGAFDLPLRGLIDKDRKILLNSLDTLKRKGMITFYAEGAVPAGNGAFSLPKTVAEAGQIHVVVNPYMASDLKETYYAKVDPNNDKGAEGMNVASIGSLAHSWLRQLGQDSVNFLPGAMLVLFKIAMLLLVIATFIMGASIVLPALGKVAWAILKATIKVLIPVFAVKSWRLFVFLVALKHKKPAAWKKLWAPVELPWATS